MPLKPSKVVFFGTPQFAVPALTEVLNTPYQPALVVSQPDARAGRGRHLAASPVTQLAETIDLPVATPQDLAELRAQLSELQPDVGIVVAYGKLLPPWLFELFPHGLLNIHPSLLPKYRGSSPIQAAILHGDTTTGVTLMLLDDGLDTGPIVAQEKVDINKFGTAGLLDVELALVGAKLLAKTLPKFLSGEITPEPQDNAAASLTKQIKKSEGRLDWKLSTARLQQQILAYEPWPGSFTEADGQRITIKIAAEWHSEPKLVPGAWVTVDEWLVVGTGTGNLAVKTLQPAGKQPMDAAAWARGQRIDFGQFS